jgi:hypothetical protein
VGDGGFESGSDGPPDAGATDDAAVDAGPLSFARDVYPIMTARCIACHTPGGSGVSMGRLDLTTNLASGAYAQLLMRAMGLVPGTSGTTCGASALTRVVPGSAQISLLYNKVESRLTNMPALCGNPMPASGAPLTAGQVATIASWIDQGANP